jgi:hypothetical protein
MRGDVIGCWQDVQPSIKRTDMIVAEKDDIIYACSANERRNGISPAVIHRYPDDLQSSRAILFLKVHEPR